MSHEEVKGRELSRPFLFVTMAVRRFAKRLETNPTLTRKVKRLPSIVAG
jgi:hypothetical protein